MKTQIEQTATVHRMTIDHLAWQLWEQEGRPMGRDQEYWMRAERQLWTTRRHGKTEMLHAAAKRRSTAARAQNFAREEAL